MSVDPDKVYHLPNRIKEADPLAAAIKIGQGEYDYLSNAHRARVYLPGDSNHYPSVEHAFQASKTDDLATRQAIRAASSAKDAKVAARGIQISDAWRAASGRIMEALVRDKFRRHDKYREQLLSTGRQLLAFLNDHNDRVWGVCNGKGENKLGLLLTQIRDDIRQKRDTVMWLQACFQLEKGENVGVDLQVRLSSCMQQ